VPTPPPATTDPKEAPMGFGLLLCSYFLLSFMSVAIGDYCFMNSLVKNVTLSKGLTKIGAYAFYNCEKLENVDTANASAGLNIGAFAFSGCDLLVKFDTTNFICHETAFDK
jgi:hypothetical protein